MPSNCMCSVPPRPSADVLRLSIVLVRVGVLPLRPVVSSSAQFPCHATCMKTSATDSVPPTLGKHGCPAQSSYAQVSTGAPGRWFCRCDAVVGYGFFTIPLGTANTSLDIRFSDGTPSMTPVAVLIGAGTPASSAWPTLHQQGTTPPDHSAS